MLDSVALLFVSNQLFHDEKQLRTCKFLSDQLNLLNCLVEKVSFVKEQENMITYELNFLSKEFDFVIVIERGTQRNLIFKTLGNICKENLVKGSQFTNNFSNHDQEEKYDVTYPSGTRILKLNSKFNSVLYYLRNIFILSEKNVELLFLQLLSKHLEQYREEFKFKKKYQIKMIEISQNNLDAIGCFTILNRDKDQSVVTIESETNDFDKIVKDEVALRKQCSDTVMEICDKDFILENIYKCKEKHIREAIQSIEKCLESYGIENVFLNFNGGKDCTVLLHLLHIVRRIRYPNYQKPIFCLYVRYSDTFPEQDKFVHQCQVYYNLEILNLSLGIKEALGELLRRNANMEACFLGTRRSDPHSETLNTFQMTDTSWPSIMRVSPLLDWHYTDIWNYLLFYKVPYCKLYDQGYTSLGSSSTTIRNPSLLHQSVKFGKEIFLPAYKLLNQAQERSGRDKIKE